MEVEIFTVPFIPLPNVVFFPRTVLPLHIFEPRYRKMTEDCLAGDRRMGVALLRAEGSEAIHKVMGIGRIVDSVRHGDGRFDLKLEGMCRAVILEESRRGAYRQARVEAMKDRLDPERQQELADCAALLEQESRLLAEALPRYRDMIERILGASRHPGISADLLSAHLALDLYARQSILAECDVVRRVKLTTIQLEIVNRRLRRAQRNA